MGPGARTLQVAFLVVLPLLVAGFSLGPGVALLLVLAALGWRWAINVAPLLGGGPAGPALRLETISASHFVEKVRWALDRLGVEYVEDNKIGALGAFVLGRTVPRLHVRTGAVVSSIGNSPEILRYLWGRYAGELGERAAFLQPVPEALELERRFDAYGVLMQQWIYHNILPDRSFTLHVWGANDPTVPFWQRWAAIALYPFWRMLMRRAFRLNARGGHERVLTKIDAVLDDVERRLGDGRQFLLGGDTPSFADFTFAALSALWVYPPGYGGGRAEGVRPADDAFPASMRTEMSRWRERYPRVTAYVERLYRDYR